MRQAPPEKCLDPRERENLESPKKQKKSVRPTKEVEVQDLTKTKGGLEQLLPPPNNPTQLQ